MKPVVTKQRVSALKMTLLSTTSHRWPYDDNDGRDALERLGFLDSTGRITLAGAMVVLRSVAAIQVPWLALDETRRVVNEMMQMFGEELKLKGN